MYTFFIKRPVTTWMFVLSFIIFGFYGYKNIAVDRFPDVEFPIVSISTVYPGASAYVIDTNITREIEEELSGISGINAIISKSYHEVSRITVVFNLDKDIDIGAQEIRDAVNRVTRKFPKGVESPIVRKVETSMAPIMAVLLHGDVPYRQMAYYADKIVKREFERLEGVGEVSLGGYRDMVMWVRIYPERLKAFNITPLDVVNTIQKNHIETPSGRVDSKDREYVIRIYSKAKTPQEIAQFQIRDGVKIGDVADVRFDYDELRGLVRFKSHRNPTSQRAIALIVYKQSKTNTVEVAEKVKQKMKDLQTKLPKGLFLDINYDASDFIKRSVNDALHEIFLGAVLTAITVFLFLGSLRMTFVPIMAIPVSIFGTIFILFLFGHSLNTISLLAIAVAIGIVIDDAIVVMESIFRRAEQGLKGIQAAIQGTRVVIFAVLSSTASLIAIFIPILFMKGVIGKFFFSFAFTLITAIALSFIVSLSFTPMISGRLVNTDKKNIFQRFYERFEYYFDIWLRWSLNHKVVVILISAIVIGAGFSTAKFVKKEFFPIVDEGRFLVRFETPTGSSFSFTDKKAREIEKILSYNPYILRYGLAFGEGVVGRPEVNGGIFFVTLIEREKRPHQKEIMHMLREEFKKLKDVKAIIDIPSAVGVRAGRSADITYIIKGEDIETLGEISERIVEKLKSIGGYVGIDTDLRINKPEIKVFIDREKAQKDGISVQEISTTINILFGKFKVGTYEKGAESHDFIVKAYSDFLKKFLNIDKVFIRDQKGTLVPLSNYIKLEPSSGYNVINRYNRQYAVTLYANVEGKSLGKATQEVESLLRQILPTGYTFEIGGQTKEFKEAFKYLGIALVIAIIAVYMILASLFESLIHPFTVLLMLPFSIFGVFGFILITDTTLNVASYFGIILLVGIITRDAVLFIDRIVQLKKEGLPVRQAILQARKERLRPILMTTFTIVSALIPVAFGLTTGSEMRQPLAIAIIGGLFTALPLSLFVIPLIYEIFDKIERFFVNLRKKLPST
ncbi:MAG: efflux RND transporter permease subunit [Aquificae bacterium]|nr:efflux RND transporter permease subunit [Aquificota bacterium]